jgi:hypothetical protein
MELALEATSKAERLLEALERNPSRLVLINAFIAFEDLLKTELARCSGYSKKALNLNFAGLLALAKKEFRSTCAFEHWTLLDNLSRLRDCAARFGTTSMPFADIIPRALREKFPEAVLSSPCLNFLQPRLVETWKFLTHFTYLDVFYHIRMASLPKMQEELALEFKQTLDGIVEYLNGPEGLEMLSEFEAQEQAQKA